jgi:hypothetical protein
VAALNFQSKDQTYLAGGREDAISILIIKGTKSWQNEL